MRRVADRPPVKFLSSGKIPRSLSGDYPNFEEKENHTERKSKSFRHVLRKSPSTLPGPEFSRCNRSTVALPEQDPTICTSASSRRSDPEFDHIQHELIYFLEQFSVRVRRDVTFTLKSCKIELKKRCDAAAPVEIIAAFLQDFYTSFKKKIQFHDSFQIVSQNDKERLMNFIEKYLTISLYQDLFSPISSATDDEVQDLELQNRIRQLKWINCQHLEILLNESDAQVRDLMYIAISSIIEMDCVRSPKRKLQRITKCCHNVLKAMEKSKKSPASADDFFPALIYTVIKANPTRLQSNINYINRFSNPDRLMVGESAYFFVNLCCAVSFIQDIRAGSLNISQKEFEGYMSGELVPAESWENCFSESRYALEEITHVVSEIEYRNHEFIKNAKHLQQRVKQKQEKIAERVEASLKLTPLILSPHKVSGNTNDCQTLKEETLS